MTCCKIDERTKKRILIVSRSFYPENSPRSFRTTELVKEFSRQGHDVTLLTVKNDKIHKLFEEEYSITIKDLGSLRLPEVSLNGGSGTKKLFKRALRRGLLQLFEYPDIELMYRVKRALKKEAAYDLLISIAVPHPIHWGVAWARRKGKAIADIWVADCGDPYMLAALDTFKKMFYFKYFEINFCRLADYISVPIKEAQNAYYPEFRYKIKVIPQGFDFKDIDISHDLYLPNPVPTFAYAGGLIPGGRDPNELLAYLTNLTIGFKFIFYTKSVAIVEHWLSKEKDRIEIRNYLPRRQLLQELSKMDFLVNIENNTNMQMPSKLIDYYLTGRPVLSVPSFGLDTGIVSQFLEGDYSNRYRFKDMDQYRIENVCAQFLELCGNQRNVPY